MRSAVRERERRFTQRLRPVLEEIRPLSQGFAAAGRRVYLVGGIVRDLLAGEDLAAADLDLTTDATPAEIKAILGDSVDALSTQGECFGTIAFRKGARQIEITTHRAEVYQRDSRKPVVAFGTDIVVDLSRRDFTVNAMALEVSADRPCLVDPFSGAADLAARKLRTPRPVCDSFADDPLRMVRAARFIARFGLQPDEELCFAIKGMRSRLSIVSAERLRDELVKLVTVEDPSEGLRFLCETGLAEEFLAELPALGMEKDARCRHKDVLAHTLAVVRRVSADHRIVRLAALFHDVGKPMTRELGPKGATFHGHDVVGAAMTRDRMRKLKFPNAEVEAVSLLVRLHMRLHGCQKGWSDAAVRRLIRDAGPLLDELIELSRCDCTSRRGRAKQVAGFVDEFEARVERLRKTEELERIRPDLDGREVMEQLGVESGPLVGSALTHLMEIRLEEGPLGKVEASRRLEEWWRVQG